MIKVPSFSRGNKNFANALNEVVEFARRHGVNPGSRSGWAETRDGWQPPDFEGTGIVGARWDLETFTEDDETLYRIRAPFVVRSRTAVASETTFINDGFLPLADRWVVARMTTPAEITLEMIEEWTGYPNAYQFGSGPSFPLSAARIPLWRLYDEDAEDRVPISEGVYGKKLVGNGPLRVVYTTVQVPGEIHLRNVPDLIGQ
jgi:hypothetical protein